jgi:S-DNA-T family DNA segregation ATPase FtsK/SpoIIIE
MPRKKKKTITIQSDETKVLIGLILLVIGIGLILAPFTKTEAVLFEKVCNIFGYAAIAWGLFSFIFSLTFLSKNKSFKSPRLIIGLLLFSTVISTLLSYWADSSEDPSTSGGIFGNNLHTFFENMTGRVFELILIVVFLIISFSLISGTSMTKIVEFIDNTFKKGEGRKRIKLEGLLERKIDEQKKLVDDKSVDDIKIENIEEKEDQVQVKQEPAIQVQQKDPNLFESNLETDETKAPDGPKFPSWTYPSIEPLQDPQKQPQDAAEYKQKAKVIEQTLKSFGIQARVVEISVGPTVARFALSLSIGTKVSKVRNLSNDLAVALKSKTSKVRIEAPIPGTNYVGIEVPNPKPNFVYLKEMARSLKADMDEYELPMILGKDITGKVVINDLVDIPHLLIAGATGTGKSVGMNSILAGLLLTKTPDEVRFIMVDPKMGIELAPYDGIPHLLNPVIKDMELVVNALQWVIEEMRKRYRMLQQEHVKKITDYNKKLGYPAMPYIVIVVDEVAELMLSSGADVEDKIKSIAQMGRAAGVHLILATQKPTVNVITGIIKSNIQGRMAFSVATAMDSRVIIDQMGAETLIGKGDMLYVDATTPKPVRIQCTYTSGEDTEEIVKQIKEQITEEEVNYSEELQDAIENPSGTPGVPGSTGGREPEFLDALKIVVAEQKASASYLQRRLRIGYNKAARIMEELEEAGAIGPQDGSKPRKVLVTSLDQVLGSNSQTAQE